MADNMKNLNTRLKLKIDTLENWNKSTLGLLKGEIAIATVAATAGSGLTEPVCMLKIGEDGVKTFSQLEWNFYAKASDVLASCKSEDALTAFVNGVIADAGIASNDAMEALAGRVTDTEGAITILNGDENTAGSVAKAIKDAIDALNLADTYVAKETGKSLVADTEIARLANMSDGANKVEASTTNGNIKIDGAEITVYTHPEKHTSEDISDFNTAVAAVKVAEATRADEATKATQDGNGKVIADTYAEKATTLAGYGIGDAYTKGETDTAVQGAKDYAKGLVDAIPAQTDYTVTCTDADHEATSDAPAFKRHTLTQNGNTICTIDIPKELVVESGSVEEVTEANTPYAGAVVGDKYIELVIANQEDPIYVPAKDLVDIYTAKELTTESTDEVKIAISNTNEISATLVDGKVTESKLSTDVQTKLNKTWEEVGVAQGLIDALAEGQVKTNKDAIEAINDETNGILAQAKAHADGLNTEMNTRVEALEAIEHHDHDNKDVLDGITSEKVTAWDAAEQNAKDYTDNSIEFVCEGIVSSMTDGVELTNAEELIQAIEANRRVVFSITDDVGSHYEYYCIESIDAAIVSPFDTISAHCTSGDVIKELVVNYDGSAVTASITYNYLSDIKSISTPTSTDTEGNTVPNGLKATKSGTNVALEIDDSITWVFDCGDSGVTE